MGQIVIDTGADLEALSYDELVELSYELQRKDDELRDFRRLVKAAFGKKAHLANIAAKLTPEELALIQNQPQSVVIAPETVYATFKAGE